MSDAQAPSVPTPTDRQVVAAIGNHYVLFDRGAGLRGAPRLGPADVAMPLPRTPEPRESVEFRIVQSLIVRGFRVRAVEGREFGDIELIDQDGQATLIEVKAGDRDFAGIDLSRAYRDLGQGDEHREIWGFNTERLSLGIIWSGKRFGMGFVEIAAVDVWEYGEDGSIYDRAKVMAEVDEWVGRVTALYDQVEAWARDEGLTTLRDRAIPMSEDLMQRFAVPDRDVPILDLMEGATSVVTMKPDGLWLIGFNGLVDVITRNGTFWLAGTPMAYDPPIWTLIDPRDRSRTPWGRDAFMSILGRVPADE